MDLSKLKPEHRELMKGVIADEYGVGYTEEQKQQIYNALIAQAEVVDENNK